MIERVLCHEFDISAQAYWDELFFNQEYNEAVFLGRLKFETWRLESQEEDDLEIRRIVHAVPPMPDLPAPLRKVIKDGLGYHEHGVFNKAERTYRVTVKTASLPDKIHVSGVTRTEERPGDRCARLHTATVEARIFGIGSMLESRLLQDMEKSYGKAAAFSNVWLKERGR